jgi:hypothetical protein
MKATNDSPTSEDYRRVTNERDALRSIVAGAQQREAEAERIIKLLILAGHLDEDKLATARELARL